MIESLPFLRPRFPAGRLALALGVCGCIALNSGAPLPITRAAGKPALPKGVQAAVTIGSSIRSAPSHYLGFSMEMSGLCSLIATDQSHRTEFENLFRDLGPVVLKLAGKGADYARWEPNGEAQCAQKGTVINQDSVADFAELARRLRARVEWGLPLVHYNPKGAAAQAKYVASSLGTLLTGFIIGNEPDLYTRAGMRDSSWTAAKFVKQWSATRKAVVSALPRAHFDGPDICCNNGFFKAFAQSLAGKVSSLTYHEYAGSRTNLTAQYLMSSVTASKMSARTNSEWKPDEKFGRVPLWLSETNTFPDGGVRGVSDSFAAALWLADVLLRVETQHVSQVDTQDVGGEAGYDPITQDARPRPLYYGMLLYHDAVPPGSQLLATHVVGPKSRVVTAYAARPSKSSLNVIVINKSFKDETVTVSVSHQYRRASFYRMRATSPSAQNGVTIGGRAMSASGTIAAPYRNAIHRGGGGYKLTLPAASQPS